ncbi:MAG: ABC transporter permease subunit [Planctomycetota bacterium]|nr:ABC transporter permease subunit [Planctomycetota bacterium]
MHADPHSSASSAPRVRKTPRSVRRAERLATASITIGGLGTIAVVTLIFAFLLWVVWPLFASASVERLPTLALEGVEADSPPVRTGTNDEGTLGWRLRADGRLDVHDLATGALVQRQTLFEAEGATAFAFASAAGDDHSLPNVAVGFADGTMRPGRIAFETQYPTDVSEGVREGDAYEGGLLTRTPGGQWRLDRLQTSLQEPVSLASARIELLDLSITPQGVAYAFLAADGTLQITNLQARFDMMTDREVFDVVAKPLAYTADAALGPPSHLALSGIGNTLFLVWRDGTTWRYDARDERASAGYEVVEVFDMLPDDPEARIDRLTHLVGKGSLVAADQRGRLHVWFASRPAGAYAADGLVMTRGHVLVPDGGAAAPTTALAASPRSRLVATAHADGTVRLYHVTTEQRLVEAGTQRGLPAEALVIAPQENALFAWRGANLERWQVDVGHPEATLGSLFTRVWYEGQVGPAHAWQSEGGSDEFEPKLGLMPLVFGTLKATLYSMLIAAPIALLAAIFTSEFLVPRWRARIKSVIEMMASLPSVVLGFLAAVVLAPLIEDTLIVVLVTFVALPFVVALGARLWQLLPARTAVRLEGLPRLGAISAMLPLALGVGILIAPTVERLCFAGDVLAWLNRGRGEAAGGWSFMLSPFAFALAGLLVFRVGGGWVRSVSTQWSRLQCALVDLLRLLVVVAVGLLLAWLLGLAFGGTDPRGPTGTGLAYQPRNAMIVGFVMGFAIVPIIYTLAEDALSSVPRELREASLGCGATPWQTAWRIVVPTAMSGLFGALMVGIGRAVGETMIVLMAAGNTAIMEWNAFNGFRTLSANIATELPEAVKDSTHYRVLFLAGFVLFAMTFALNTVAELVRRRVRRRLEDL